ncbi:hypothetical protein [Pseudobacteriovorax antillogorgiicola]|uniref:Chlorophyllase enzyme n=1 Tax=Pseudobacteriovorax antillogorgiicola TaxID=1513793 RepID=A0A1Y6CPZ3_9BACT|nr:hypothetical protein [Pseudobacteriovorax antillogorgiicola]TCS42715.1 hypothetical protein EDD56_1412 [Pseudobacteriovorax antillogorgiicola]SMF82462.1 hypothetical protein SAMN06296036_14117 [Pseudobacteriovorax antillogorgiicola]
MLWILAMLSVTVVGLQGACAEKQNYRKAQRTEQLSNESEEDGDPSKAPLQEEFRLKSQILEDIDPLEYGPYEFQNTPYASEPGVDPVVLPIPEVNVDARGMIYLPLGVDPNEKFPVIVIFTGNHSSCGIEAADPGDPRVDVSVEYRLTGACPEGQIEAPSHLGYEYLARQLTSWGYAVVSINPNLGVQGVSGLFEDDALLIRKRAALLRKNIDYIKSDVPLGDRLDFNQLGLVGHSRGGETVRAFYNIYDEPGEFQVRAIYEIAPVDFGTGVEAFDPGGIPWAVLIGACDGDVSTYGGINPYLRLAAQKEGTSFKTITTLLGANHNFFNTEWQNTDARLCQGEQQELWDYTAPLSPEGEEFGIGALKGVKGSEAQRTMTRALVSSFFRAFLGAQKKPEFGRIFDPIYRLPSKLDDIGKVLRETTDYTQSAFVDEVSSLGTVGQEYIEFSSNIQDVELRNLVELTWQTSSSVLFYQSNLWEDEKDLSEYQTLSIPIARREICNISIIQENCAPAIEMDFSIQLVAADESLSKPILASSILSLSNIINRDFEFAGNSLLYKPLLFDTLVLPIAELSGKLASVSEGAFDFSQVKGIRYTLNQSEAGTIFLSRRARLSKKAIEFSPNQPVGKLSLRNRTPKPENSLQRKQKRPGVEPEQWKTIKRKAIRR